MRRAVLSLLCATVVGLCLMVRAKAKLKSGLSTKRGDSLIQPTTGNASIITRTCSIRRTTTATSTIEATAACTTVIRPKCGCPSTTSSGTTTIPRAAVITGAITSISTCINED